MSAVNVPTAAPASRSLRPKLILLLANLTSALMLVSCSSSVQSLLNPPPEATDLPQRILYILGLTAKALILQHLFRASQPGNPASTSARRLLTWSALFWVAINTGLLLSNANLADRLPLYQADALLTFSIALGACTYLAIPTKKPSRPDDLD